MTDDKPLARKVAALVAENAFEGSRLKLGPSGNDDAIGLVLDAVDNTMMLRDAVFAVDDSSITLRVSGKRVLMVTDASHDLGFPEGLLNTALSPDTEDALTGLATALRALTEKSGSLTLVRETVESGEKQSGAGVGIQTLSGIVAASVPVEIEGQFGEFLSLIEPIADSLVLVFDGMVEVHKGDQPKAALLQEAVEKYWTESRNRMFTVSELKTEPKLQILDGIAEQNQAMICVNIDENQCFADVSVELVPQVLDAWATSLKA